MDTAQLIALIRDFGFPVFIAAWVLVRWERLFNQLIENEATELELLRELHDTMEDTLKALPKRHPRSKWRK